MRKPVPPAKFSQIVPPNENYAYFEDQQNYPFVAGANSFNLINAGWLADFALLGADLALLAAERALRDGGLQVSGVYTFGSPCVGDAGFREQYEARGLQSRTYSFVNNQDVVRRLPPGEDYQHVGQLIFIDASGQLHEELAVEPDAGRGLPIATRGQELTVRLFGLLGRKVGALLDNLFTVTIPAPFADHAPIYYATHIWNSLPTGK